MKRPIQLAVFALLAFTIVGCNKDTGSDLPPSDDPSIGKPSQVGDKTSEGGRPANRMDPSGGGGKSAIGSGKG